MRVFVIIVFLSSFVVQRSISSSYNGAHFIDKKNGLITYEEGIVYVYDSTIYIPVILSIPVEIDRSVEDMFETSGCGILDFLEDHMKSSVAKIQEKIPVLDPILSKPELKDMILNKGKLAVNQRSHPTARGGSKIIQKMRLNKYNMAKNRRQKRVAWLAIGMFSAIASLGLLATANRVDIEVQRQRISLLEGNQDMLRKEAQNNREAINLLIDNQEQILMVVNNITERLNEVIEDYNCEKHKFHYYADLVSTWTALVPNAFIRALNGAISGRLTVDLLPGDKLHKVIQYYPEFRDTIFTKNPTLLYESAKVKVVKIEKNPPMLEVIISVPRILDPYFGVLYKQRGCTVNILSRWVRLRNPSEGILSSSKETWWNSDSCLKESGVLLCDIRDLHSLQNPCLNMVKDGNISGCDFKVTEEPPKSEVVRTEEGVLVCVPQSVVVSTRDAYGVFHARTEITAGPTYYGSESGDQVMVNDLPYNLHPSLNPIVIKDKITFHPIYNSSEEIDKLSMDTNFNHIKHLDVIPQLQYHQNMTWLFSGSILVMFIGIVSLLVYRIKYYKKKNNKRLGYLMNQITTSDDNSKSLNENPEDKETPVP